MKKKYLIVGILSILIMMLGVSYAYFTSMVIGEGAPITVKAKKLAVLFTDTSEITGTMINPGWEKTKTFTVENKSGGVFYYDINIENLVNTFVTEGYLQYKITSTDGGYNMGDYQDIPKSNEIAKTNLVKNIQIKDKIVHTYKVEFRYKNSTEDQSADMGALFSGSLSIIESNVIITKYKVNNVIQDTIPDKTEPIIVDKVECTNNAKGKWNDATEKVELEEAVTQTVCIVSFKEGYSVNILAEHGEVVTPESKVVGRIGETSFEITETTGYSLENASVVCDGGAEGNINGRTIIITNIKQNNECKVITNPVTLTVTYNVNGGNAVSPTSKEVTYTGTYGSLPTPTRTGHTFAGWYTSETSGTKIEEDTEVTNANNHTIYAHWTINSYNVTVKVVNGTPVSQTKPVNHGGNTTFSISPNSGYKLDGADFSCDTGGSYNQAGTVTFSNVTGERSCTITLVQSKVTLTMTSSTCPNSINDNREACYIISHGVGTNYQSKDWKETATINNTLYTKCVINSYEVKYGNSRVGCNYQNTIGEAAVQKLRWGTGDNAWYIYGVADTYDGYVRCSVTLTCEKA